MARAAFTICSDSFASHSGAQVRVLFDLHLDGCGDLLNDIVRRLLLSTEKWIQKAGFADVEPELPVLKKTCTVSHSV